MAVPIPRRVEFGASISRLSTAQLHRVVPYIVVDGTDDSSHGGTSYQTDGRGLRTPPFKGGMTMWQALQDEIHRRVLRASAANRDWVIMELGLGTEDLDLDAPIIDDIVQLCASSNFRLAWVLPHVYYGAKTAQQQAWNDELRALLIDKIPPAPDGILIDWDAIVEAWTAGTGGLTAAQKAVGEPLLYDGRHPRGVAANPGYGCERFANAIQAATGL